MDYFESQEGTERESQLTLFGSIYYYVLFAWYTFIYYYENYGWYIFALLVLIIYVYVTKIQPYLTAYFKQRDDAIYEAKYHKDPDIVVARLNDQQEKIARLQKKYNHDAKTYRHKQEERELKKREEWLKNQSAQTTGNVLGDKKKLKSDYNPLMGENSRGYKAPKRKTCGGGGCG